MQITSNHKPFSLLQIILCLFICITIVSCGSPETSPEQVEITTNDITEKIPTTVSSIVNTQTTENKTEPEIDSKIDTPPLPFKMTSFTTDTYKFVLEIPSEWIDAVGVDQRCGNANICFASDNNQVLIISEANLGNVGGEGMTIFEYVDIVLPTLGDGAPGYEFISKEELTTLSGHKSEIITYTLYDGAIKAKMLWYAQGGKGLNVLYMGFETDYGEIEETVDWSFRTVNKNTE